MISNLVYPWEYSDPFWAGFKQINVDPFDELKKVVNQMWHNESSHYHFSPPSKNFTWEDVLQPALRCLKMLNTCERAYLTKDKDYYKIYCDTSMLTKDTTVRFKYLKNEYKIHITISWAFTAGPWYCCPSGIYSSFEKKFIELLREMKSTLPTARSQEAMNILVNLSQSSYLK